MNLCVPDLYVDVLQGLLLDLDVAWPPNLRKWFSRFNFLNVNLEIARPECSGEFGAKQKQYITVTLPFAVGLLLGVYVLIQYFLAKRLTPDQFKAKHSGRGVVSHLFRQVLKQGACTKKSAVFPRLRGPSYRRCLFAARAPPGPGSREPLSELVLPLQRAA